jgi:hypothetical protein
VRENEPAVRPGQQRPVARRVEDAIDRPQDERIKNEGKELAQRIAAHVDVDEVKRRIHVSHCGEPGSEAVGKMPPRPAVQGEAREHEAQRLHDLDGSEKIETDPVEDCREVIRQRGVKIEKWITQAVSRVGHPARREDALAQICQQLVQSKKQERAVAAAARIDDAGAAPQRERCQQRQQ